MVETDLSKSNVEWRHENMGRYTHTHRVSMCGSQHIHVHMAIWTFAMLDKYTYVVAYPQPDKPPSKHLKSLSQIRHHSNQTIPHDI